MKENFFQKLFSNKSESGVAKQLPKELPDKVVNVSQEIVAGNESDVSNNKQEQKVIVNVNFCPNAPVSVDDNPTSQTQTLAIVKLPKNIFNATENSVIVYVQPNGEEKWSLGVFFLERSEQDTVPKRGNRRLFDYVDGCLAKLRQWFEDAIANFGEQCQVVIIDETIDPNEQKIQWEMLHLGTGEYLGCKATIVHWIKQSEQSKFVPLNISQPRNYEGRLVAYIHPDDFNHVGDSLPDAHTDLMDWQEDMLQHNQQPIAIALIHCNGHLSNGDEPNEWNWENLNCDRLKTEVDFQRIAVNVQGRPFFLFVNAPYSARLIWDKDSFSRCLTTTALSKVASGYFGTMGDVQIQLAIDIKNKFLKLAKEKDGVKPASFLREIRKFHANDLLSYGTDKKREAEQIFSYVYYGNPDDVVKITGGGQL